DVTVGVWVGNCDRAPLRGSSGVTGAGPIFHAVMLAAQARAAGAHPDDTPLLAPTADVREATICALSGERATDACPSRAREWVAVDRDLPPCSWHHRSDEGVVTVYPSEYRAWAAEAHARNVADPIPPTLAKRAESRRS